MKNHKFQQIRIRINSGGESPRFSADVDKQFERIRGIYVSLPADQLITGATLGFKVNGQDVLDEDHEVRMLTSGNQVSPNTKFFLFEESLEGAGSSLEGRYTDGAVAPATFYPYDAKIYLWLINEDNKQITKADAE